MEIVLHTIDDKEFMATIDDIRDYPRLVLWTPRRISRWFAHMDEHKGNYKEFMPSTVVKITGEIEKTPQ